MAELTGLSVRVSAATASFRRGINSAQESAQDLALSLRRLGAASSSAERDLDSTGRSAITTAASLGGLSVAATNTSTAFLGLSVATVATLVPALITLSSVLFPIVGALGGLVAVAAGIGAVGLGGTIAAIATNTEELKSSFMDTAETFQEVFEPAITAATLVLSNLLNRLEGIAPALALSQDEIFTLQELFIDLGAALIELLPAFVDLAVTLTEEFLPGFVEFVENVGPELPGIVMALVDTFEQLLPQFRAVGRFLTEFLPEFTEFGFLVLNTITPALSWLGNTFIEVTRRINNLDNSLGSLIASGSILAPVVIGLVSLLGGPVTAAIGLAVGAVIALRSAWESNFAGIRDNTRRFGQLIQSVLPAARQAFNAFVSGINLTALRNDLSRWASVLDTEVRQSLIALRPVFRDINEFLRTNQSEFETLGRAVGTLASVLIRLSTIAISILGPAFREVVIPALRTFIDVVDFGITKLAQYLNMLNAARQGNFEEAFSQANMFLGGMENPQVGVQTPGGTAASNRIQGRIEIALDENTELVNTRIEGVAEERAELVVQQQGDRATRNSGTGL